MIKKFVSRTLTVACLLSSAVSMAQNLSKKEVEPAIHKIARLIDEQYVFAAKGKQIAQHLRQQYKQGKFNEVKTWQAFDSLTSKSLREFSRDGHLYVRYDPKTVKELATAETDSAKGDSSEDLFYYGEDAVAHNFGFTEVKVLEGNIGYIKLSEINISEKSLPVLVAAMQFVSNTRTLIIDLQNNGGGGSAVGSVLESFFLPKETPLLEFKTRDGQPSVSKTVNWLTEKKYDKPLFVLVNKKTFSAAEAFAYALQAVKRAVVVGQPSGGGAHMNSWYPVNEHLYVSVSTGAPTLPGTEESWERKGVQPDHQVPAGQEITVIRGVINGQ